MVRIPGFHPGDPGSNPGYGIHHIQALLTSGIVSKENLTELALVSIERKEKEKRKANGERGYYSRCVCNFFSFLFGR